MKVNSKHEGLLAHNAGKNLAKPLIQTEIMKLNCKNSSLKAITTYAKHSYSFGTNISEIVKFYRNLYYDKTFGYRSFTDPFSLIVAFWYL